MNYDVGKVKNGNQDLLLQGEKEREKKKRRHTSKNRTSRNIATRLRVGKEAVERRKRRSKTPMEKVTRYEHDTMSTTIRPAFASFLSFFLSSRQSHEQKGRARTTTNRPRVRRASVPKPVGLDGLSSSFNKPTFSSHSSSLFPFPPSLGFGLCAIPAPAAAPPDPVPVKTQEDPRRPKKTQQGLSGCPHTFALFPYQYSPPDSTLNLFLSLLRLVRVVPCFQHLSFLFLSFFVRRFFSHEATFSRYFNHIKRYLASNITKADRS